MPNLKLQIEYDGTAYAGWQKQRPRKKQETLQDVIERALRQILNERIRVTVAGRTDAGVHALAQVANFHTRSVIPLKKIQQGLNSLLPQDIAVKRMEMVSPDFHSRFSAKSKVYRYTILNRPHREAISRHFVCHCRFPLNLRLMQKEAKALLGRHDFTSFAASAAKERNPLKEIKRIRLSARGDYINIEIEADGFLYNMVRNIVGTLIDIGRGRFPVGSMEKILESRDRKSAGTTAPAHGLCLVKVKY